MLGGGGGNTAPTNPEKVVPYLLSTGALPEPCQVGRDPLFLEELRVQG